MSETFESIKELQKKLLEAASRESGQGSVDSKIIDMFHGIDISGRRQLLPPEQDQDGLVFFTKPHLNLSHGNIVGDRTLVALSRNESVSFSSAIRAYLDPRSHSGSKNYHLNKSAMINGKGMFDDLTGDEAEKMQLIDSLLVDHKSPFIPILTNTLTSLTGWPDLVGDVYSGQEGMYRQSQTFLDGTPQLFQNVTLTANFQNIRGNPTTLLLYYWIYYALAQHTGIVVPWPDQIVTRRINYTTRIFKLILDSQRRHVIAIASAIAFPTQSGIGGWFNHNRDEILKTETREVTFQFQTLYGVEYLDPIIIEEFNGLVSMYNPDMRNTDPNNNMSPLRGVAEGSYERVEYQNQEQQNFVSYPRINPGSGELEWYVPVDKIRTPPSA